MICDFSELILLAVDRFWRRAQSSGEVPSPVLERALLDLLEAGPTKHAKAWAAVMLSAACLEKERLGQVATALLADRATCEYPSSHLVARVGFTFAAGRQVQLDAVGSVADSVQHILPRIRSLSFLNNQAISEIAMAIAGTKVSRLVLSGRDLVALSSAIDYPIFVSAAACESIADHHLGGFSNVANRHRLLKSIEPDDEIYAYFGLLVEDRALVAVMDNLNGAGRYLGIPECCRDHFRATWDSVRDKAAGDMAFDLLSRGAGGKIAGKLEVAWQCNPYGMYRGGGLLWHFPCSVTCSHTIELVNGRFDLLNEVDQDFAAECKRYQTSTFWLGSDRRSTQDAADAPALFVNPM